MSIRKNMRIVLVALSRAKRNTKGDAWISGNELQRLSGLEPADINDSVEILETKDQVKTRKTLGTHPFKFYEVTITAHGRLEVD